MLNKDSCSIAMKEFLDGKKNRVIVYATLKDELVSASDFPPQLPKKAIYFLRELNSQNHGQHVDLAALEDQVMYGDVGNVPLAHLALLLNEVYTPILRNKDNQSQHPEFSDILKDFYKISGHVTIALGKTRGKTLLPLPPYDTSSPDAAARDRNLIYQLESAITEWTRQINQVTSQTSEQALLREDQNPGPLVELDFWAEKAANLTSIHEQLSSDKIRKIVKVLELARSQYRHSYQDILSNVSKALREAEDNVKYLTPLRKVFVELHEQEHFSGLPSLFQPMLHLMNLIWDNSPYYRNQSKIANLFRMICNEIIYKAHEFLSSETNLLKQDIDDALSRLEEAFRVCNSFKYYVFEYKNKIQTNTPSHTWPFGESSNVLTRLNNFVERLRDIIDLLQTIDEFTTLEKVEIGGTKGKILSAQLTQIYTEFNNAVESFQTVEYDILDTASKDFERDWSEFRLTIKDLERRVGHIITQGFADSASVVNVFKLLDSFDGLLNRETIQRDFSSKYADLLHQFADEITDVHEIFRSQKHDPPIFVNMPPVAGALRWSRGLMDRITGPWRSLKQLDPQVLSMDEAKEVLSNYQSVMHALEEFERGQHMEWARDVDKESQTKLRQSLLQRDAEENTLMVNFDPTLVALLREVKYFLNLSMEIPEQAGKIYDDGEMFRNFTGNLDLIVNKYNHIQRTLLDVERPLVQDRLSAIDDQLEKGISQIDWKSHGIKEFIETSNYNVDALAEKVDKMKANVAVIENILETWWSSPLLEQGDTRRLLTLDEITDKITSRYEDIAESGKSIKTLVDKTGKILEVAKTLPAWKNYVSYLNGIVYDGLFRTVQSSLEYLTERIDPNLQKMGEHPPLLEADMMLVGTNIMFRPDLDGAQNGLEEFMITVIKRFFNIGSLLQKLDHPDDDFLTMILSSDELRESKENLHRLIKTTIEQCRAEREQYMHFAFLWKEDRSEYLQSFLNATDRKRTLSDFEDQIKRFSDYAQEVANLHASKNVGWLRINSRPFLNTLSANINKWKNMFTDYLYQEILDTLRDYYEFVDAVTQGMETPVEPGDFEALVTVMGHLHEVKVRSDRYVMMFEPLRDRVALLRRYGRTIPPEVMKQMDEGPQRWIDTKRLWLHTREALDQPQKTERTKIKERQKHFEAQVTEFRKEFLGMAPFNYSTDLPTIYQQLDHCHERVHVIESEANELSHNEDLFELNVHEYRSLKDCRTELTNMKLVWDTVSLVLIQFDSWNSTPWNDVNTDVMEDDTKKFEKTVRSLDRSIKSWGAVKGLHKQIIKMATALPLISSLRSPELADRHWKQIMKVTGKRIEVTDSMLLQDMFDMNLDEHQEDIVGIVERAKNEFKIQQQLDAIENVWASKTFVYEEHERTGTPLLGPVSDVIDTLEEHQLVLTGIASDDRGSKHFADTLESWLQRLNTVYSVVRLWRRVQKAWDHLENIFIGSKDIREQLPEDSKRFDGIDADFKESMNSYASTPNVLQVCMQEGMWAHFKKMDSEIEACEKSLDTYLEGKRLAFPRFYFISELDTLTILAKGHNPLNIQEHLGNIFDIAKLEFKQDKQGNITKEAIAMISREGERVALHPTLECVGPVEVWMSKLVEVMRSSLRHVLKDAMSTYEYKPREDWIEEYPSQIALLGSQIVWTHDVENAFKNMADGADNSMKLYHKSQQAAITNLITRIQGKLDKSLRTKIMTVCTIDVHSRDIVGRLIEEKEEVEECFSWQSQLRFYYDQSEANVHIRICDASFHYGYEYLGNTGRLVVTPLTDRCYITLTQALHLAMGGAPAGPAGTGKTETTKDLGRALGLKVYVFNCSEQMTYISVGNTLKGLSMSGTWGCFDEFNRISIEVLSVVATQVKTILDAMKRTKISLEDNKFSFEGTNDLRLIPTAGFFITMNPGYAGRTELPENIKALFRPVSMVVPDLRQICEIKLYSEGFEGATPLSRKFTTLFSLSNELLSKQKHYEWGLRSIKAVLTIAGRLKRQYPTDDEDKLLYLALRDFNLPKLHEEDISIFRGLIRDLFPKVKEPEREKQGDLDDAVDEAIKVSGLQNEGQFKTKVLELSQLLSVRHCIFVIGDTGTGKTSVWQTLAKANDMIGQKTYVADLNPKAMSSDDLYGYKNNNNEWTEGLLSFLMREFSHSGRDTPQWLLLDGDIDAGWIETMNTVMDDNKVLTLANNDRVFLTDSMRLIFEVDNLRNATLATVSRAGVLFINEHDIGFQAFINSWIERRENKGEQSVLTILFSKFVRPENFQNLRAKQFKFVVPMSDFAMVNTLCDLLEGLLIPENVGDEASPDKDLYETYFLFALIWAVGGALMTDFGDTMKKFNKFFRLEFRSSKLPPQGHLFEYCVDPVEKKFVKWTEMVPEYQHEYDLPVHQLVVHTAETTARKYWMRQLMMNQKYPLLVGPAGVGKTMLIRDVLDHLPKEMIHGTINFNHYTDSYALQVIMEQPAFLQKTIGFNYAPPNRKKLVLFIDDLNMPRVDEYGTQSPITLLRQHLDYGHWYDRKEIGDLRKVHNVQYIASMNPNAGNFTVNPRLQRHFAVFYMGMPNEESLKHIFSSVLAGHFQMFHESVRDVRDKLVKASLALHSKVSGVFPPNTEKFHYQFNMRDLSNLLGGLLVADPEDIRTPMQIGRLWFHEAARVYGDRLIDDDPNIFNAMLTAIAKQNLDDKNIGLEPELVVAKPCLFSYFSSGLHDKRYGELRSYEQLSDLLTKALQDRNETSSEAYMDLVLFQDAMEHVCRINRIIESPAGNALLVGVGGSGKQSLSRLASYISGYDVFQLSVSRNYGIPDLKKDLQDLYIRTGVKKQGVVFLLNESHISQEEFLVFINDLLASGNVPDLFPPEDMDSIISSVTPDFKETGQIVNRDNVWAFFIEQVRQHLHVILAFSPAGDTLRIRARKFPALVNSTVIDWFHPWPESALVSVAGRFLEDTELDSENVHTNVVNFMAYAQQSVQEASEKYLLEEKRHTHVTPKSFLESVALYKKMLADRRHAISERREELENGLHKLENTSQKVAELEEQLRKKQVMVAEKTEATNELLALVGKDRARVDQESKGAAEEEQRMHILSEQVGEKQRAAAAELAFAMPELEKAQDALGAVDPKEITQIKAYANPPVEVAQVLYAIQTLTSEKPVKDRDLSWNNSKKFIGSVTQFMKFLTDFDAKNIPSVNLEKVKTYTGDDNLNEERIKKVSSAAGGLWVWLTSIINFNTISKKVDPLQEALDEATAELNQSEENLKAIKRKVDNLNQQLEKLTERFQRAREDKVATEQEAAEYQMKLDLARRLINGLASERQRWGLGVEDLKVEESTLVGDVLLSSVFISYAGSFNRTFRDHLVTNKWVPFLQGNDIPLSENIDLLSSLTDEAEMAQWFNEGLPTDKVSVENAVITLHSERWPLFIDPQLQASTWIRNRLGGKRLITVRMSDPEKTMKALEMALTSGDPLLIENIGDDIDPMLETVVSRKKITRGHSSFVKLADREVEWDDNFQLFLQTKDGNPHFKPELQAETTLINFTVTEDGLEEQLLAQVMQKELPELEQRKMDLIQQQNDFKITLKQCQKSLLENLSNAQESTILTNTELIENLEKTKEVAKEIDAKFIIAIENEAEIDKNRDEFRPAAARAALLYFLLDDMSNISHEYRYSLVTFTEVFNKAIDNTPASSEEEETAERVANLVDSITYAVFTYVSRGLFERHKMIFSLQLVINILAKRGEIRPEELSYLLRGKLTTAEENPLEEWLTDQNWLAVKSLSTLETFHGLADDVLNSEKSWRKWMESEVPEKTKMPSDWRQKDSFQKLLLLKAFRLDRLGYAVADFVREKLGDKYVEAQNETLDRIFLETNPGIPVFFILSPGVDPVKSVEALGKQYGKTTKNGSFLDVALGQGQAKKAEAALRSGYENGSWVVLENIHLTPNWMGTLERTLEEMSEGADPEFRVWLTAEPEPEGKNYVEGQKPAVPSGILQSAIKVTNEPPTGIRANFLRAWSNFNQATFERVPSKANEFKTLLFSLNYFHSLLVERRKFGFQGWNRIYNFNIGDLTICVDVLVNYLEKEDKIPWDDLRYMFGEIMYGGHISDDWDRRLCSTYLSTIMNEKNLFEDTVLMPSNVNLPTPTTFDKYTEYITDVFREENPNMFGLHSNSEIGSLKMEGERMLTTILALQSGSGGVQGTETPDVRASAFIREIMDRYPALPFDMDELLGRMEPHERNPYVNTALQECERMNTLIYEIRRSLKELEQGINGELTMSDAMERLMLSIFNQQVPESWANVAYPSVKSLGSWISDLGVRVAYLDEWSSTLELPVVTNLSLLFSPQSFLTSCLQTAARKHEWQLDQMSIQCEVYKKSMEDLLKKAAEDPGESSRREGVYVQAGFIEGARYDTVSNSLKEAKSGELHPASHLPVLYLRAIQGPAEANNIYQCPVYYTPRRGPTYVWTLGLRTTEPAEKWVLAGTAILLTTE
eukprot:TRINITY_DN1548_c0_g2_i8.p1 TRINITY_DN1548_c0_g2~~TRINITY_DN1548_c0_g2_i8.p1  ORF type:complete len:4445 (-),score=1771.15 TRINITY_DN1548_c0_g2_i8:52-13386(-)